MYDGGTATEKPSVRIYLDGKAFYDAVYPTKLIIGAPDSVYDSNNPLLIGKGTTYQGATYYHRGLIDDIRIYQDELTPTQIQQLYAEGAEKHGLLVKQ